MIDRDSRGLLAVMYLCAAAVCAALVVFVSSPWIVWPSVVAVIWFCVWQAFFFHVPVREYSGGPGVITAVSDGKVVICEKAFEPEVLKRDCIQVSIYMNFFDVHANFWPLSGKLTAHRYCPGKHMLAFKPKASLDNEHTWSVIEYGGSEILFKQIAGGFARRIVLHASDDQLVTGGTQCGIIKFGSRIDYYFPLDTTIEVKVGDMVRACESVIARLSGVHNC